MNNYIMFDDDCTPSWESMKSLINNITWVWSGWLPNGFVTMISASSGEGKSLILLRIASCFTDGRPWPDGTPFTGERGYVLWCEGEAAEALNIDRALKLHIDTQFIITPFADPLKGIDLENKEHRARLMGLARKDYIKLIVIDSLRGTNSKDENSSTMNEIIKFLAEIARDNNKPIIVSHHLRKKNIMDGKEVGLDRIRGSSAIIQTARVVWVIDPPNEKGGIKRLSVIKSNLGKFPPPLGFQITDGVVTFCESPKSPEKKSQLAIAMDFIRSMLINGPQPAQDIEAEAKVRGIANRTLKTAKNKLRVESRRSGGTHGEFKWHLPVQENPPDNEELVE